MRVFAFVLRCFLAFALTASVFAQGARPAFHPSRILAKPRGGATETLLKQTEADAALAISRTHVRLGGVRVLTAKGPIDVRNVVAQLQATGQYEYVEPDYIRYAYAVPNDPKFVSNEQWGLRNTGNLSGTAGADIDAVLGWDTRTSTGSVLIGILDSGIRTTHEDLQANLWQNPGDSNANGADDDSNGYVDDRFGANFIVEKSSALSGNVDDNEGHGTGVASVAGAVGNNGVGMAGVAWQTKLVSLKWADKEGTGYSSAIASVIDYAIAKGIRVINISYGSAFYSQTEYEALKKARDNGIIIVAAAGNDGENNDTSPHYPASYDLDNIISVGGSTRTEQLWSSSNYGASVDLVAPSEDVLVCDRTSDSAYRTVDGTSFAAPHVAGALGLLLAANPAENYRSLINKVLGSTERIAAYKTKVITGGRLNLANLLKSDASERPHNDRFATAAEVAGDGFSTRTSLKFATAEAGAPAVAGQTGVPLLWYKWTASRTATYSLDLKGSEGDTVLGVFTGDALASLTSVTSNDDATGLTSRVTFAATSGSTYRFAVGAKANSGALVIVKLGAPPANDAFASALVITETAPTGTGTLVFASKETGEPSPAGTVGASVWYRFRPTTTKPRSLIIQADGFDAEVHSYTGSSVGTLSEVSNSSTGIDYHTYFNMNANTDYWFRVDSNNGSVGSFRYLLTDADTTLYLYNPIEASLSFATAGSTLSWISTSGILGIISFGNGQFSFSDFGRNLGVHSPVLTSAGNAIFADSVGTLANIQPSGAVTWEKSYSDVYFSGSVAIGADSSIYVHSDDGKLRAYFADGSEKWSVSVPGTSYASPSIDTKGRIFIGSTDTYLYCLQPQTGAVAWRFKSDGEIYSSAAIDSDGSVIFATLNGSVYRVSSTGQETWRYQVPNNESVSSSPAIAFDRVYFGSYDGKLYALNAKTGAFIWAYATGDEIRASSPAVDSNGTVYIGSYDDFIHAVRSDGTLERKIASADIIRSSPLIADNYLWWGSSDGAIYGMQIDRSEAPGPWPMHRQNARRTGRALAATAPVFIASPKSAALGAGSSTTLSAAIEGEEGMTFQWYKDGVAISGATKSSLTVSNFQSSDAGSYTLVATNARGSTTSSAAVLTFALVDDSGYLYNLSVRSSAGSGARTLTAGFTVGGAGTSGDLQTLARASGPALTQFGVTGVLADPLLKVNVPGNPPTLLQTNDNWASNDANLVDTTARVGGFSFGTSTLDSAVLQSFAPGGYTVEVGSATNGSGLALVELYDASPVRSKGSPRFTNLSARSQVGTGQDVLVAGFAVRGTGSVKLLIRASGPALTTFGVTGVLTDPLVEVNALSDGSVVASNDNWSADATQASEIETIASQVGAFSWQRDSRDAALVVTLPPGNYTATVKGVNNTSGVGLVEVYEVK